MLQGGPRKDNSVVDIEFIHSAAKFDKDRLYRYTLERFWREPKVLCNFVMLNPSTADALVLDPTVTRCVRYAYDWGFDGIVITNIFAIRSTKPGVLYTDPDPVGKDNDDAIESAAARCDRVVAAWGIHGALRGRGPAVAVRLLELHHDVRCLGLTKTGHPRHPLYLRRDTPPVPFKLVIA